MSKAKAKGMEIGSVTVENVPFANLENYITIKVRPRQGRSFVMYTDRRVDTHGLCSAFCLAVIWHLVHFLQIL